MYNKVKIILNIARVRAVTVVTNYNINKLYTFTN